jgi:hypothetical protein
MKSNKTVAQMISNINMWLNEMHGDYYDKLDYLNKVRGLVDSIENALENELEDEEA